MKKFSLFALTILSLSFVTFSCELLEGEPPVALSPNFIKNVAIISFTDDISAAASGFVNESLDGTKVTVAGPDADKVFDLQGGKNFVISGGSVTLMLDPNINFATQAIYNVEAVVEANGFLKTIIPVRFVKDITVNAFTVAVLNTKKLPSGTSLETKSATLPATGIVTPLTVVATGAAANDVATVVTVPRGTIMTSATGAVLSGTASAQVVSFNASQNEQFFPGGLRSSNVVLTPNAAPVAGVFQPAAFASVTMTVGGTAVKGFTGQKVEVKMSLEKDALNTDTNTAYVANDDIDVYSYNTTTGQWEFGVTTKVRTDTNGSLVVLYETSHLSYFMSGRFRTIVTCPSGNRNSTTLHTVNWVGTADAVDIEVTVVAVAIARRWVIARQASRFSVTKNSTIPLEAFVSGFPVTVEIRDVANNALLARASAVDMCTPQTFNLGTINSSGTVTLNFTASCQGIANIEAPTGTQVQYRDGNSTGPYRVLYTVGANRLAASRGSISTTLLTVGQTYDFKVVAGNLERFRNDIQITSANMSFNSALQSAVCDLLRAR